MEVPHSWVWIVGKTWAVNHPVTAPRFKEKKKNVLTAVATERAGYLREAKCSCSSKPFINSREIWVYKCEIKCKKKESFRLIFSTTAPLLPTDRFGGDQDKTHKVSSSKKKTDEKVKNVNCIYTAFFQRFRVRRRYSLVFIHMDCCRDEVYL